MAAPLGKIPTTSVRRLISPFSRSMGLVECSLARCSLGKGHVGQHVGFCLIHDRRQLWHLGPDLVVCMSAMPNSTFMVKQVWMAASL
jgi:hypothetical protein